MIKKVVDRALPCWAGPGWQQDEGMDTGGTRTVLASEFDWSCLGFELLGVWASLLRMGVEGVGRGGWSSLGPRSIRAKAESRAGQGREGQDRAAAVGRWNCGHGRLGQF